MSRRTTSKREIILNPVLNLGAWRQLHGAQARHAPACRQNLFERALQNWVVSKVISLFGLTTDA